MRFTPLITAILLFSTLLATDIGIRNSANAEEKQRAAIITDEVNGIVRIVIDGREIARFTAEGLEVRNDIRFGGVATDEGPDGFEPKKRGE
jgi:hypothetical protein